ncbi:MAG: acetylglutamate kinase [Rhodospirillales bacterium]|nr:acetylglutamate kinase [Rhodospirillales bacterium]
MFDFHGFYSHLFKGKLFLIKAGGRVITDESARENLLKNIKEMTDDGIKVLLVYGGGHVIDDAIKNTGRTSLKLDGLRVTTAEDIALIQNVMAGDLAFRLTETMKAIDLEGICLNAVPPSWGQAQRRSPHGQTKRFDGTLQTVDPQAIRRMLKGTSFIACPCLAMDAEGQAVNINADNVAVELAAATKAAKLIFLTDTDGVLIDGKTASVLTAHDLRKQIAAGMITGGMKVKMENCIRVLEAGARRVHILNGFKSDALRDEIYTASGCGTMIVRRSEKKKYDQEQRVIEKDAA